MPDLRLDWCSYEAAKSAVKNWHYSAHMPAGKLARVGVWEDERFVGCVLFGRGATGNIGRPFGLSQVAVCELVRVALRDHASPTTRILAIAIRILRREMPGIRVIVSFADEGAGHSGTLYRAGAWIYLGSVVKSAYVVHGRRVHARTMHARYGRGGQSLAWLREHVDPAAERVFDAPKRKFAMAFDPEMRELLNGLAKPYPKRAEKGSPDGSPVGEGGSIPTSAHQSSSHR